MDSPILAKLDSVSKLFLGGPFGAGKTTLAVERVRRLLAQGTRGDAITVLAPQPVNTLPFAAAFASAEAPAGAQVRIVTFAQLAHEVVTLHWPEIARATGFRRPGREPTFLNVEGAQYHLGHLVDDALASGAFDGVALARPQIVLQILTNLSRIALAGERPSGPLNEARTTAVAIQADFRTLCLEEGLIDFSLLMDLARDLLLPNPDLWQGLGAPPHLVADNVEEENPLGHALLRAWLPRCESALICADDDGGIRTLLGADAAGGYALAALCEESVRLSGSFIMGEEMAALERRFARSAPRAAQSVRPPAEDAPTGLKGLTALTVPTDAEGMPLRFFPQMVAAVAQEIVRLVEREGVPPGRIAIVAPALSDSLRFSLERALARYAILTSTHRPSRALADEPAARTLLTFIRLAHPQWGEPPAPVELQQALLRALRGLDPLRAALLVGAVYAPGQREPLRAVDTLPPTTRRRLPPAVAACYEQLRAWLEAYRSEPPIALDLFLSRLFEELLSGPDFAFHDDADAVRAANQMVESERALRQALEPTLVGETERVNLGEEYVRLVQSGALGALYVPAWTLPEDAVLIAPPAAFLLRNEAVDAQIWLDAASPGWVERSEQSLGEEREDAAESFARAAALRRTVLGLLRRTRRELIVAVSLFSESGYEQRGPLLPWIDRVLAGE